MLKMVNYLRGETRISIEGGFSERFLNICSENGIAFWGLAHMKDGMLASVHIKDMKKIRDFAQSSGCVIRAVKNRGVPVFLGRFKRRYALIIGLGFFIAAVYAFSLFIWEIEVSGMERVPKEAILNALTKNGVKVGGFKGDIDHDLLKNQMLLDIDELSWIAVNIKGSRASVDVRERIPKPEILAENLPCNVVAGRDGLIVSMNVLRGSPQVSVGQTVHEGQLLVSGVMDSAKVGARFVHAMAKVKARTWYTMYSVIPLQCKHKVYTGRENTRHALVLFGKRLNLYFNTGKPFDNYDKIIKKTRLGLFGRMPLPFAFVSENYTEYEAVAFTLPTREAEAILEDGLGRMLEREMQGKKLGETKLQSLSASGFVALRVSCESEEEIGLTIAIPQQKG